MKTFFRVLSVFIFIFIAVTSFSVRYIKNYLNSSINLKDKFVTVEKGYGVNKIIQVLNNEKIINNKLLFKIILIVRTKNNVNLKYGEYFFKKNLKISEVMDILISGKNYLRSITFAEGLTNHSILKLINENEFLTGSITSYQAPEGVLLPETYFFQKGDTREGLIKNMREDLIDFLKKEWEKRADDLPYKTMKEALIMASIIEKETGVDEERGLVASVFVNRLKIDMPLQTDPTSIYGYAKGDLGKEKDIKTHILLRENSPYNTYKNKGLPPTPICNPGKKSIIAALHPTKSDYIFFVADGDGKHLFAEDYEQHKKNVELLKKKLKK
ncbi:MAG: endolytic transglycosylase MltG [Rickettsiales bacterium]|jgi:UPF0755 protein|nr:endolytic transglycosylase MltG [Rickettsiales bacterium]